MKIGDDRCWQIIGGLRYNIILQPVSIKSLSAFTKCRAIIMQSIYTESRNIIDLLGAACLHLSLVKNYCST